MKRYDIRIPVTGGIEPSDEGGWVLWGDVKEAIELLKQARHVCAYPDLNTDLLAEIDDFLKRAGETSLPELY